MEKQIQIEEKKCDENCTFDPNKKPSYCRKCHRTNSPLCKNCGKEFYNSISSSHCYDCDIKIYGRWD